MIDLTKPITRFPIGTRVRFVGPGIPLGPGFDRRGIICNIVLMGDDFAYEVAFTITDNRGHRSQQTIRCLKSEVYELSQAEIEEIEG